MKVTIRDCLQLESFRQSIVVAGEKHLDKKIKSLTVMDANQVEEAVKLNGIKDSMVLTAFSGMKDDVEKQFETIVALGNAGVSAIVYFQRNKASKTVDNRVVDKADKLGIPFIIIVDGESVGYTKVLDQVNDILNVGSDFKNSLMTNVIFHLLNFEKHPNFQHALKEAAINNDFQIILLSEDFNPIFVVETRYQATISEAIRKGKEVSFNLSNVYSLIEIDGVLTYWGIVDIKGDKYYLIIVDNDDKYSTGEINKLAEMIELAMGMWKFTPEKDAKADFLRTLMRGNKSLAYTLKTEAGVKERDIISVFHAKNLDTHDADEVMDDYINKGLVDIIKIAEENELYGIIFKGKNITKKDEHVEKTICTQLFDRIKSNRGVRIFHVTGIHGIEAAADGFRLIGETWNLVENVFPYKRVFSKYELALVSTCINIQVQEGHQKKNYMDFLEAFTKEGDNKSRQLLKTLETFVLDAGMNSSKTAEFMGVHTNTVQYRLKKINEILGVEITGNRVIPGLTLALALKRMEKSGQNK